MLARLRRAALPRVAMLAVIVGNSDSCEEEEDFSFLFDGTMGNL